MTKWISKLLALTLSFAMVITGFGWLGAAGAYAAADNSTIKVKVVDQNGAAVEGVQLYFDDEGNDVDFDTKTDADGIAQHTLNLAYGPTDPESEFDITTDDYEVTSGLKFTFALEGSDGVFKTVNGEAFSPDTVYELTVKTETPVTEFVVTFDANGGAVEPASAQTVDGKLAELPKATKEGFAFRGWFTAAENGEKITADTVFTADTTIYAQWLDASTWEATDFTYGNWTWSANDGLYPVSDTSDLIQPELWVVSGMSETGKLKLAAGNTKLVIPAADPEGKKVQGVLSNAFQYRTAFQPENLPKLTEVVFPEVERVPLEKQNWEIKNDTRGDFFIGASAFLGNAIEKIELADGVVYIGNSAFNGNSLTEVTFPASISYIGNQSFAKNTALATLTFPDKTDLEVQVDAGTFGMSVIEKVQMPPTTAKLHANAFLKSKGQPKVEITIDGKILPGVTVTSNYHDVIKISHTITFDAGEGGSAEFASAETFKNKLEKLPEATRDGFGFTGWFTAEEGGDMITADKVYDADTTLYAHWGTSPAAIEEGLNNLPEELTPADKETVEKLINDYDALSEGEKAKLPAGTKEKLEAAEAKIEAAEAKSEAAKYADAVSSLATNFVEAATGGYTAAKYTEGTYKPFAEALNAAKAVIGNKDATTADLEAADLALSTAKAALVEKSANSMKVTVKTKTVKVKKVKKAKQTVAAITVTGAKGAVTYKKAGGSAKLTVNAKTGKITVKKGTKKGTYKVKVTVTAAGDGNFKPGTKTVTVTIKVK